jgi:hypothetical protein
MTLLYQLTATCAGIREDVQRFCTLCTEILGTISARSFPFGMQMQHNPFIVPTTSSLFQMPITQVPAAAAPAVTGAASSSEKSIPGKL